MRNVIRVVGVVGALGAGAAFVLSQRGGTGDVPDAALVGAHAESPISEATGPGDRVNVLGTETSLKLNVPRLSEPTYAEPSEIERQILQVISERRPSILSINSVTCGPTDCEIAVVGADTNPRVIDAQANLSQMLYGERWREFRILGGGMSTREIAPGAREYVITFTYQPLVDLSADPRTAARQQAACAAAWRRQTTNPTPPDSVRQYLEIAEQHLALAAVEIGSEEAERIAQETNLGPLIRECGLQPQP